jgi:hypothetical protein
MGANQRGLHMSVLFPFRPGHPPLFVPWEDVSVTEGRSFFLKYADLSFRRVPGANVRVAMRLADALRAEAGLRWPPAAREPTAIHPA